MANDPSAPAPHGEAGRLEPGQQEPRRLESGDVAPEFSLPDADGTTVSLSDFRGRRVVVYFYPAADTPGCTTEACDFRDNLAALGSLGVDVVGISPDTPAKLARFRDRHGLTFPLLADPQRETLQAYGAYGEKKMYGRTSVGVIRSTVLVSADGTVERVYYNVRAKGHVDRVRSDLESREPEASG